MVVRWASGQLGVNSWYFCRAVALCVGCLLFSTASSRSCLAESVSYFGRDFRVDKLERVDGDQLSIELDKRSFLVRSANAGRQVFDLYAQKPELLPSEELNRGYGSFIGSLAGQGETKEASTAIRGILSSDRVTEGQKNLVFGGIAASAQGEAILREEILSAQGDARRGSCLALTFIHSDGQASIRKLLTSHANWMSTQCPRILITAAQASFESGDRVSGEKNLGFVGDFFAGSGGEVAQAAKTSSERLTSVQRAIDSGDADQFESELRVASFDALLGEYYQRFKPTLVIQFGERAFIRRQPAAVLRGLSLLDFSQRNSRHHEFLLKAVQELQCKDLSVLQMGGVKKMLVAYASKDEAVKQQYLSLLSFCSKQSGEKDDGSLGMAFISLLSDVRPDPCVENDILRSAVAESLLDRGNKAAADVVLSGMRTKLPWIYRFRLLLKSDAYILGMVVLGLVVVTRWFVKFGKVFKTGPSSPVSSQSDKTKSKGGGATKKEENKHQHRAHFSDGFEKQMYKGLDEYSDCLSKLDLKPGASLADIKNAYRSIVKAVHPDINPKATKEDTNRFIELTKTYERILVLHEEREKRSLDS